MIKYLFILINSLAVFFYSLYSGDNGVTVSGTLASSSVKAGQELQIEIKIVKGSMAGFAKFQLELPDGVAIKETENKGANYTYSNGAGKWVWASLPAENDFTIKMTLITSGEASGTKTLKAKFSYVEDNAKQVVEMVPTTFSITPADDIETAVEIPTINNEPAPNVAVRDTSPAPPPAVQNAVTSNNEPPGKVSASRTVTKIGGNEFVVKVNIKKDGTKGFARYSDDLPEGLIVKAVKTDGSSFSVGDGKLKFVWVNVPNEEELELEYTINSNKPMRVDMIGEYSYLEDNQSKKFILPGESVILEATIDVPEIPAPAAVKEEPKPEKEPTTQARLEAGMTKNEGKVDYHVQIGAFTNAKVDAAKLKRKFKVLETISSEMQGGFSKFMVGSHDVYQGAHDHREVMKNTNGIKSAFVVAYNGSKRITVQEALMMTNQKWYK
jgi:hypothetical protein